jgi:hypothetical protein
MARYDYEAARYMNAQREKMMSMGTLSEEDLPQVLAEEDVVIDLIHSCTGKTHQRVDCEIHHQIVETYQ